jgi:hypothetical protein
MKRTGNKGKPCDVVEASHLLLCNILTCVAISSCTTELVRSYEENEEETNEIKRTSSIQLEITAYPNDALNISFSVAAQTLDIDWGDGQTEKLTPMGEEICCKHRYSELENRTITVGAEGLTTCFFYGSGGEYSRFEKLKVTDCPSLERLVVNSASLTSLEITKTPSLKKLRLFAPLRTVEFINTLTSLKELLLCTDLTVVALRNPSIETLYYHGDTQFDSKQLSTLDLSGCKALRELESYMPNLKTLNVSGCTALERLTCAENKLTQLDLNSCTALTMLNCSETNLTNLNLSNNKMLEFLVCSSNHLAALDLKTNTALTYLNCAQNQLKELNLSSNVRLQHLDCSSNSLLTLDLSKTTDIQELDFSNNKIASLTVDGNVVVRYLNCHNNILNGNAINKLFLSLPRRSEHDNASITVSGNIEGTNGKDWDITIATAKRWKVLSEKYRSEQVSTPDPEHR